MSSFLRTFVDYLRTRTDAPADWSLHAGMATLSIALGNRVAMDGRSRDLYANLWVVNIGGSGMGKSVALDFSQMVLRRAGLDKHVLADSFSGEALYDEFHRESNRIAYFQEFGAFMDQLGREYMGGTMKWLTGLYDVPEVDRRVLRAQTIELRLPFLTILGASTPEWFADSFKANMLRGGFLGRFIFAPADQRGAYVPEPGPHDQGVVTALADHLRAVADLAGRADFRGALPAFAAWDESVRREIYRGDVPPEFGGLRSRSAVLAKKAALIYRVSDEPGSLAITERDLERAVAYVERSYRLATTYLTERVAHNPDDADCLRVVEIVARLGGRDVPRQLVLKNSHLSAYRLDRAERTLRESGRLEVRRDRGSFYSLPGAGQDGRGDTPTASHEPSHALRNGREAGAGWPG